MSLADTYEALAPSIVAFIEPIVNLPGGSSPPPLPRIFGTGFFVHPDGIVATNRHVVEEFAGDLAKPTTKPNVSVMVPWRRVNGDEIIFKWIAVNVRRIHFIEEYTPSSRWYGDPVPDLAFVQLEIRGVVPMRLADEPSAIRVGTPIATAGFPLGDDALTVFGEVNQLSPFLRAGIVSSVFPFSMPHPHGFAIDILQQGGSSGSPVFRADDGAVIGMMSSSLLDYETAVNERSGVKMVVRANTNISICVPAEQIDDAMKQCVQINQEEVLAFPTLAAKAEALPDTPGILWTRK